MRIAAYITMGGILIAALAHGEIAIALAAAGAKTAIVGVEYMELRHAARAHMAGFVLGAFALTAMLAAITTA